MTNLTKQNFWNTLKEVYPVEMAVFCAWIDRYKQENKWEALFGEFDDDIEPRIAPKYHDLPLAMQIGIFSQFMHEMQDRDFQPIPARIIMEWFKEAKKKGQVQAIFNNNGYSWIKPEKR